MIKKYFDGVVYDQLNIIWVMVLYGSYVLHLFDISFWNELLFWIENPNSRIILNWKFSS